MKKKFLKALRSCLTNSIIKIIFYIFLILLIFYFYGVFDSFENSFSTIFTKIREMFTSEDTLSIFFVAIISICAARVFKRFDFYLEESSKIDDDHHGIVVAYNGHKKIYPSLENGNFYDKDGVFMSLNNEHIAVYKKSETRNNIKDKYSNKYKTVQNDLEFFAGGNGKLLLPSINVFTNVCGNTAVCFDDSDKIYSLPDFVMKNAENLLAAHKNSKRINNDTVRLNDFSYSDKVLTLCTQRTMYYHMLITNRCMDYEFGEGLTVRSVYEYRKKISPLDKSVLGNQIGINGLILTKDGYVLIEKRDHKKITWKNKFAQPISLALKVSDLRLGEDGIIDGLPQTANDKLKYIIEKTVKDNFGLVPGDYEEFCIEKNFLGIARDLLEGGKPNLYMFITVNHTAEELQKLLEKNASADTVQNGSNPLETSKLTSDYYLAPYKDLRINYKYSLRLNRKKSALWIRRRIYPRTSWISGQSDKLRHTVGKLFTPIITHECGEALLVSLSYIEMCKGRIDAIDKQ